MKRIIAILLTLLLVFSLAACDNGDNPGGNTNNPGTQGGETDWTAGFNLPGLTAPAGSTAKLKMYDDMSVTFEKSGSFTDAEVEAFAEQVWNLCMEVSPDGIYKMKRNSDGSIAIGDSIASVSDCKGNFSEAYTWDYTDADGNIMTLAIDFSSIAQGELKFTIAKNYDLS